MGKIKSDKKGIFFTFIAITIIGIFILVSTPQSDVSLQKDTRAVAARITAVDRYVDDLQSRYLETVLRATTYKTLLSLVFYMNTTSAYLTDLDAAFQEVAVNGTINKVLIDSITNKKIMENSTLINWSNRIIQVAQDTLNVNTTITINNVSVSQTKPWNVDAILSIDISVKSNVAEWHKKNVTVAATLSIEGLHDPYYLVNTNREYTNQIKRSSVEFNKWNITFVREHLRNGTYVHWENSKAPTFLMRFTNTITNSSCCGIESLVDPNRISSPDRIESYVDYLFWSHAYQNQCNDLYNITKPPSSLGLWDEFRYFKLDTEHAVSYNITSQDAVRTC